MYTFPHVRTQGQNKVKIVTKERIKKSTAQITDRVNDY